MVCLNAKCSIAYGFYQEARTKNISVTGDIAIGKETFHAAMMNPMSSIHACCPEAIWNL